MDDKLQKIGCPVCQHPIYFEVKRLIQGESFICANCKSAVSLSSSSSQVVQQVMSEYEKLKVKKNINDKKN
ncbi:hypothetical protein [Alistipes sp. ZOR0009]|uniref:hypothetical protein n=1 Tax=Alistipes sp. ZOR0009 TaxID=1339253 RepID=UPI0006490840|nr:hypothetical protein [Alistipes sp. ZOR0009]